MDIRSINVTPELLKLIAEIEEFKGAWKFFSFHKPERLEALKKVATIESIGSSTRIEGAKLNDRQVEALLSQVQNHSFQTRDEQEVAGYALVCEEISTHYAHIPFNESVIKQLHQTLLRFSAKDDRHRGEYKKIPIRIEAFDIEGQSVGVLFETTSPLETPYKMQELIHWTNEALEKKELHPLLIIGLFVVLFLAIHPFQDGNGRLSRLLTTLLLLKNGYPYATYSSLESVIENNKESYYFALQKTQRAWQQGTPDWQPWLLFFCQALQRQKIHLEKKLQREQLLQDDLSPLSAAVLQLLAAHGSLSIGQITTLLQANRNTLKKTLAALVLQGRLSKSGIGKAVRYKTL